MNPKYTFALLVILEIVAWGLCLAAVVAAVYAVISFLWEKW